MIRIGNDSPVWFRPPRHVYFLHNDGQVITDAAGRNRYFKTYEAATRALFLYVRKHGVRFEAPIIL